MDSEQGRFWRAFRVGFASLESRSLPRYRFRRAAVDLPVNKSDKMSSVQLSLKRDILTGS